MLRLSANVLGAILGKKFGISDTVHVYGHPVHPHAPFGLVPSACSKPLDFSLCVGGPDRPPNSFHQIILAIVRHPSCRGTGSANGTILRSELG